jgi:hypothetical protein
MLVNPRDGDFMSIMVRCTSVAELVKPTLLSFEVTLNGKHVKLIRSFEELI